ncbi:MAG TPA: hypothetical protein VJN02_08395 [Gammaproteobacteria bacterium]|nr:hypothetical protein [Gammaproteobacteria bacterium]
MSFNVHLRNVDSHLMNKLKSEATKKNLSINTLILNLLNHSLGIRTKRSLPLYHDLDKLAGTWDKQQAKIFLKQIIDFEQIDEELWK